MPTSLVTGGAGFIGSHLVNALLGRGDKVRVLDNFSTGTRENLQDFKNKIELITGDLRNPSDLNRAVRDVDFVFHQAAFVSVPQSMKEPDTCFDVNVSGTSMLLSAARQAGVKRVVLASSAAVYGDNTNLPLNEDLPVEPLSPYAASKHITEIYARLYTSLYKLDVVALRYFNVFGPFQNPTSDYAAVIPIFVKTLLEEEEPVVYGDGQQSRDFIYISDVVQANLLAAESSQAPGQTINICSGEEINLLDLIATLSGIFGREITPSFKDVRPGDIYRSLGDPALAKNLLGFSPVISLEDGLRKTTAWMKGS